MEIWFVLIIIILGVLALWMTLLWSSLYATLREIKRDRKELQREMQDFQKQIALQITGMEKKIRGQDSDVAAVQWHFKSFQAKFLVLDRKIEELMKK